MERARSKRVAQARPAVEITRRVDGAVVAQRQERPRVNLEMEVERRAEGVAGVTDEAEHRPGLDPALVEGGAGVPGEVGVVELVAEPVAYPEPPPAEPFPPDSVQCSVGDGDDRRAERGEDIVAVMP